jgi:3-dehydroquinate dehydratase/shikimate dehydrogenase
MNKGKICVSVCAEHADEFVKNIERGEEFGDVVELRFDFLAKNELENALKKTSTLKTEKNLLLTFRPKQQGGMRDLSRPEREIFWSSGYDFRTNWADVEIDLVETVSHRLFEKIVCSHHDFNSTPENLVEIYEKLNATNADVIKIAVQTDDITDSIGVWKLLKSAKSENRQIIPIAMGEAGKWTRILGLAHGAFMTYASLAPGNETAPGQISAKDLIEVYRVKELDKNTEIYGIIGGNTSYSLSPFMHNAAFKSERRNAVFVPFQVKDLDAFLRRMVKPETREIELNFKGFSVTIPHKQAIIKHLDFIDETAEKIGAVNTVKIENGKFYGYNTDAPGFIEPLKNVYGELRNAKVAILGAGGAARACVYALKKENAEVTIFARNSEKAKILAEEFEVESEEFPAANRKSKIANFDVVINTTPLGTKGELENETALLAGQLEDVKLIYDLIYNPFQTRLMSEADKANVPKIGGMAMLTAQGAKQFEIWTGKQAPVKEMSAEVLKRLK